MNSIHLRSSPTAPPLHGLCETVTESLARPSWNRALLGQSSTGLSSLHEDHSIAESSSKPNGNQQRNEMKSTRPTDPDFRDRGMLQHEKDCVMIVIDCTKLIDKRRLCACWNTTVSSMHILRLLDTRQATGCISPLPVSDLAAIGHG